MSLTTMDVPFCSSTRVSGSGVYTSATLECNWNEDRVRLDAGEYVYMPLMEGAQVRPEETDISIAPPTRDRGKASDGRLVMPHRSIGPEVHAGRREEVGAEAAVLRGDDACARGL